MKIILDETPEGMELNAAIDKKVAELRKEREEGFVCAVVSQSPKHSLRKLTEFLQMTPEREYQLREELKNLEAELEYQVSHKRIQYLQKRINEIEKELAEVRGD